MHITEALSDTYFTSYHQVLIHVETTIKIEPHKPSDGLIYLLKSIGSHTCAIITAFNPVGQEKTFIENRGLQEELRAHTYGKWRTYSAVSFRGEDGCHIDISVLIVGISIEQARELAFEYGQPAFLYGHSSGKTELFATLTKEQKNLVHPAIRRNQKLCEEYNIKLSDLEAPSPKKKFLEFYDFNTIHDEAPK